MKQQKPILHARDHLPGGADPLPHPPDYVQPPATEIPGHGGPTGDPASPLRAWHWWRFQTVTLIGTPPNTQPLSTPDIATNAPADAMQIEWQDERPLADDERSTEVTSGHAGPNPEAKSILRLRRLDRNPDNWWTGTSPIATDVPDINWGMGGDFTLLGWFNFTALRNWDILNIQNIAFGHPNPTYLLLRPDGGVTLHRFASEFGSAGGLITAGSWNYIAVTVGAGRVKVYVNPGPPEAQPYDATYGNDFPFPGPMGMETWGLENGDYTAAQLAARLTANGFKSVAVQLNGDVRPGSGRTHADYIATLTADVATLQAAGITVIGWGVVDSTTAADLAATGVTGWLPQIEGPDQYTALDSALTAGVGAGLPKALVTTYAGLDSAKVANLKSKGITGAAVETYAEAGYPYNDLNRMLWQGTQIGFTPGELIPMVGTYRGETPADYTGFDETVLANYGIYNTAQTSVEQLGEFGALNTGTVMVSKPVIDVPDPATTTINGIMSVGGANRAFDTFGADGAFEGYVSDVVLYEYAISSSAHRSISLSGTNSSGPGGGTVPPQDQIPTGGITPSQIAPGTPGQHLVTTDGTVAWVADTGGGGAVDYENVWNASVAYQAGDVVTYNGIDYLAVNPSTGQTPPAADAGIPYSEKGAAGGVASLDTGAKVPLAQLPATPSCRVFNNAPVTIANAVSIPLPFNSERWDNDAIHDTVTNNTRLICKTAGKYMIVGNITFTLNPTGGRQVGIRLNATSAYIAVQTNLSTPGLYTDVMVATVWDLAVNDFVELMAYQNTGGNLDILYLSSYSPEFSITRIGA